jgi:hypothetical protein
MFEWVKYRWTLLSLDWQERKLEKEYEAVARTPAAKKDNILIDNWYDSRYRDYRELELSRTQAISRALLREADELHLPRPNHNEAAKWVKWQPEDDRQDPITGLLSPEGMTELRQAIRRERKERREAFEFWLKAIGGVILVLTGLVGALIGLLSIAKPK